MTAEAIDRPAPSAPVLRAVSPPAAYVPVRICRCGHEEDAHEHHRPGSDCGACGSTRCRTFRRRTGRAARSSFRGR